MPSHRQHEPTFASQVARLEALGVTNRREQAAKLAIPYSTFMRRISKADLKKRPSVQTWFPWRVAPEHHSDTTLRKLRHLAQAADGRETRYMAQRSYAIQWARRLVQRGLDVTYDHAEGFSEVPADPNNWHLRRALVAAEEFVAPLPRFYDLDERPN